MKHCVVHICALLAVLVLAPSTVMAQRFDLMTFDAPAGWSQQALGDGLMFELRPVARSFCQMFLRRSRKVVGPLSQELDRTWAELSRPQPLVATGPDPAQLNLPGGWTLAQRVGQSPGDGVVTMLNLFQKDDRVVSVVVNVSNAEASRRCGPAIGDFLASLRMDASPAASMPLTTDTGRTNPVDSATPRSDPALAAKFGNSVVGTWRYGITTVSSTQNAPSQIRNGIEVRFSRDGTYAITVNMLVLPGGGGYNASETGTYQVEGQRIRMRPRQTGGKPEPYVLDWFFGDHPSYVGNWGLILRCSNSEWLGSYSGGTRAWRTFKPPE